MESPTPLKYREEVPLTSPCSVPLFSTYLHPEASAWLFSKEAGPHHSCTGGQHTALTPEWLHALKSQSQDGMWSLNVHVGLLDPEPEPLVLNSSPAALPAPTVLAPHLTGPYASLLVRMKILKSDCLLTLMLIHFSPDGTSKSHFGLSFPSGSKWRVSGEDHILFKWGNRLSHINFLWVKYLIILLYAHLWMKEIG